MREDVPDVASSVDGWERNTAVDDLQVGLVLEHQLSDYTGWHGLGEAYYSIVGNGCTAVETDGGGENNARSSEELDG